jgi:hypothetical protein
MSLSCLKEDRHALRIRLVVQLRKRPQDCHQLLQAKAKDIRLAAQSDTAMGQCWRVSLAAHDT